MQKDDDDERGREERRRKEYTNLVFEEMLASMRRASARNHMRNTKIKTGPDADAPQLSRTERMRQHWLAQQQAKPPEPPKPPKPAKSNVVELRPTPKKTDMAEVFRKSDFWLKLLGQKIRGDWTGFEIHAPPGSAERAELYREVNEEYRRITGEDY